MNLWKPGDKIRVLLNSTKENLVHIYDFVSDHCSNLAHFGALHYSCSFPASTSLSLSLEYIIVDNFENVKNLELFHLQQKYDTHE